MSLCQLSGRHQWPRVEICTQPQKYKPMCYSFAQLEADSSLEDNQDAAGVEGAELNMIFCSQADVFDLQCHAHWPPTHPPSSPLWPQTPRRWWWVPPSLLINCSTGRPIAKRRWAADRPASALSLVVHDDGGIFLEVLFMSWGNTSWNSRQCGKNT